MSFSNVREAIEKIVCTEGEDAGVVLVSDEAPTRYDPELRCSVYLHEHFSPLGDALVRLHQLAGEAERIADFQVDNLAILCRRLIAQVRRHDPTNDTADAAENYLRRHNLEGSILKTTGDAE